MAYEIELEDGTVLEVEDGVPPEQAEKDYLRQVRVSALKTQNPAEYDPTSEAFKAKYGAAGKRQTEIVDMSPERQQYLLSIGIRPSQLPHVKKKKIDIQDKPQLAATGSGMLRSWKGLTNLVLPDSLTPEWASDENIREQDERDKDLPFLGKMAGSVAATAPLSAGLGSAQRGLTALSTASKAPAVLTRALGSAPARAVLEGGTQGAIFADPDEQGEGALMGAALGYGLNRLGAAGGRVMRGTVKQSQAAKDLAQLAGQHGDDIFLPIAQAADEGDITSRLAKSFYKEALPIVPGTSGKLEGQATAAQNKLREIALKEALPPGGALTPNAGEKVDDAVAALRGQFDKAYDDTVKSYAFNIPSDLRQQITTAVKASGGPKTTVNQITTNRVADDVEKLIKQFADGKKTIDGTNLLNVKREIGELIGMAKKHEIPALRSAEKVIDDIIVNDLKQGGSKQNLADLKKYLELTPAYRSFQPVAAAAKGAADKEGRFLFRTLARAAKNSPEQRVLGQLGRATVDKPVTRGGVVGKILAGLGTGGLGYGAFMAPHLAAATVVGGNALATKGAQKFLLGSTKVQRKIAEFLRNHPDAVRRLGSAGRASVVTQTGGSDE